MKRALVILAVLVVLVACDGKEKDLIGRREMVGAIGGTMTMEFMPGGRFVIDWGAGLTPARGDWTLEDGKICYVYSDDSGSCEFYKIEDDYLTLAEYESELQDSNLILRRTEK